MKLRESTSGDLKFLADYIYQKVFYNYTFKHWNLKPEELDSSVTARVPVFVSRDDRYFQDTYQAIPLPSYAALFNKMLAHPNIKRLLNTDYREVIDDIKYTHMIYTGPIDAFFDYKHGELPYRSLQFDFMTKNQEYFQEAGTINYPNEYEFTRILEQKHLTGQVSPNTTITYVYPQDYLPGITDPYYPIPRKENRQLYQLYREEAEKIKDKVLFAGRLADYKYYNMDQAVARALTLFNEISSQNNRNVKGG